MLKIILTIIGYLPAIVFSLPENAVVNGGEVSFQTNNNVFNIHQQSNLASINYSSFNIQSNEVVNFIQPNTNSIALNRVTGNSVSQIFGQMNSNGQVFLVNPNGILFAAGSSVNTGGLFATTLNISDSDFFNKNLSFDNQGSFASIINHGVIQGEYIALVSPGIDNHGELISELGNVHLHAADAVEVSFNDGINIKTTAASYDAIINNHGTIAADGGQIVLTASARNELVETVINNEGIIRANSIQQSEGRIFLVAQDQGDVINAGVIDASAADQDINGGEIHLTAQRVAQLGEIHADGLGDADGGVIHMKADKVVALGDESITTANAGDKGSGGEIIALSPDTTLFRHQAVIESKGGSTSGNGGYVDVSGYQHVEAYGLVDVSAVKGAHGTFLIDPTDITIAAVDINMTPAPIFEATAAGATLNLTTLNAALDTGAAIEVRTDTGFNAGENGDITIANIGITYDLNGDGTSASSLSLIADGDIIFSANSSISEGIASPASLDVNLIAGGEITFGDNTSIETNGGNFVSTSGGATRVLPAAIGGDSLIDAGAGTINITTGGSGNFRVGGIVSTNATTNAITLNIAGDITDAGETHTDISAVNGRANITARGTQPIETNINEAFLNFTGTAADITNSSAIDIVGGSMASDLTVTTAAGDITVSGNIDYDGANGSALTLNSAQNININNGVSIADSNTLTTDIVDFSLDASAGTITTPDAGLHATGNLMVTTQDIVDSDRSINLSAIDAALVITAAANNLTINSNFDRLDASIVGGGLSIIESNALQIANFDATNATAINIADGDFSVQVQAGGLIINDTVRAQDVNADGTRSGMIDLRVDNGDLFIGNIGATNIESLNAVDQNASGGLNGNQESIRIYNPSTADINSDIVIGNGIANDVQITAEGGDVFISNESTQLLSAGNTRNVTISSDVTIDVYNLVGDPLTGTTVIDADVVNNGTINIKAGRSLIAESTIVVAPPTNPPTNPPTIPPVIPPNVIDEITNEVSAITQEQQITTDPALQTTSADSQFIFNQVFTACDSINSREQNIKCGQEKAMQGFLNSLLIGGSLPEMKTDEK